MPKHLEILAELPKTAVGKVFKPDLRRRAIARVFDAALAAAGSGGAGGGGGRGPAARAGGRGGGRRREGRATEAVGAVLGRFTVPWRWRGRAGRRR